jgi:diguanylate cyclase (GGDEF)-like protein/PAS domain S-box-containing protein
MELQTEIAQRREVERRLAETASIQRAILDSANFTIISTDTQGVIRTFSATAERLLGYTAEEVIGKLTPAILHDTGEVATRAEELTRDLEITVEPGFDTFVAKARVTGSPDEREWTYIRKDGTRFPVRLSITALKNDTGEITGYLGVGFDITAQKQDEERLRRSEERWKFALEGAGDGVWDWNVKTSEVIFSRRWKEMLGFAEEEIGTSLDEWSTRVHPDDMPRVMADIQTYIEGKTTVYVNEHRVLCKDGSWKWILDRGMLISRDKDGSPLRMIGTHADITERKNAEVALFKSREALAMAQRIVNLGSWDWDIITGALTWSDEIYRIFGLRPKEFGATYEAFLSYIHHEDRARVVTAVNNAVAGVTPYDIEHRVVRPTGETRYVHERGEITRGPDGAPIRMLGTVHDITEKKIAEEGLRLSQKVFQSAGEAIVITDSSTRIVDVNPAYETITGFTRDEAIGKTPAISKSGHHEDEFYANLWRDINNNGQWSGEIWDRRKSGDAYPALMTINVIRDDFGAVTHYVAVFTDITRQKSTEEKLERLAYYDPLTRLPNRALFRDRLRHSINSARRADGYVALFFIDLDRFKHVNDTLGHAIGDELLVEVSRRIADCIRKSDTVSRLGGDEFTVILEDIHSSEDAAQVAQQIIASISSEIRIKDHEIFVGASVGIGIYPTDGQTDEELIKNADIAMYQAKFAGRGVYKFFTREMNERAIARQRMESGIRRALANGEFTLYYQPKIDLSTGRLAGAEALIRWIHPAGMISPDSFITVAEETGLILEIDDYVLARVCADLNNWRSSGAYPLRVSVNISARHFHSRQLLDSLQSILSSTQTPPDSLEIEITESAIMQDAAASIEILRAIREMGIHLSIDDFGTGYSSLSYLKKFPVDILKIDKSFVLDLIDDKDNRAIVASIISLGKTMGLEVVAEGVETVEHARILKSFGANIGQGYYYAKPLHPNDFEVFARNNA